MLICLDESVLGHVVLLKRPAHTHANTHTHTLSNIRQALYNTNSIRYSTQWALPEGSNMIKLIRPLSNRKCTTDRITVWQPCVVRVVQTEGLTERHPHVCKSPPSVKLATDCHASEVTIQPFSVYILFLFFF